MKNKLYLAIVFGAKSSEHEVSIVTAFQAWNWIDPQKYNRFLVYIDQNNQVFLCPPFGKQGLKHFIKKVLDKNQQVDFVRNGIEVRKGLIKKKINIDCALLIMHGAYGEDGRIQGTLDFYDIPFTCSGVFGSSLGMDKAAMKAIFTSLKLNVPKYDWFWNKEYQKNGEEIIKRLKANIKYPMFVKPANGGSSVGISKVKNTKELKRAIKVASGFDRKILIEESIENAIDINCAVMGGYEPIVSACEQPISDDKFLSFGEKYLKGGKTKGMAGLARILPAPIPEKTARQIQEAAKRIFREFEFWGTVRIDFLYQKKTGKIYPTEPNTIPGSMAYYLWQASGIKPPQLIDKLVELAIQRSREINKLNLTFKSKILDQM